MKRRDCSKQIFVDDGWPYGACRLLENHIGRCELDEYENAAERAARLRAALLPTEPQWSPYP